MNGETYGARDPDDETLRAINDLIATFGSAGTELAGIEPPRGADMSSKDRTPSGATAAKAEGHGNAERRFGLDAVFGAEAVQIRGQLNAIEQTLAAGDRADAASIPGYFNQGAISVVFRVQGAPHGSNILAKIPWPHEDDQDNDLARMVQAFTRGRPIPGLANMVAYSAADPHAMLVEEVEGDTLASLETRSRISLPAFRNLLRTYRNMHPAGLVPDNLTGANTTLTPDGNLVVVDYDYDPEITLMEKVVSFGSDGVLLDYPRKGTLPYVPDAALLYRRACYEEFGMEYVRKLDELWGSYGIAVPRFDENA